jgi:hypothetical protein
MNLHRWIPMRALLLAFMSLALAGSAALRDDATLFFKGGRIQRIVIELAPEAIEALRKDPRAYAPCVVREGDRVVGEKAGIKLKGAAGSFQEFDARPAFTINIDKFGEAAPYHGLAKFHLNNSVQDESLLSEWTCSEILRSADQPATRVTHARVMVAGRDLGVYVLKEAFDEKFLARNFKAATGNLYDGGFCQDLNAELERDEGKGADDRADLRAIAQACADPDMKKRWERIEKLVDIDHFVRFVALEAMLGHWDGYAFNANNYRLYFEPGRKARFLPHGMDQCFGDPGASVLESPHAMLAQSVMRNPEWRKQYRKQITRLLPEFDAKKLIKRLEPVQRRLQEELREVGVEPARVQAERAKEFVDRLTAREVSLREQSVAPEPKPLVFRKGVAVAITGWHSMSESEDATVEEAEIGGAQWYRAACGVSGKCVAGWRRSVLLTKGRYRFEAFMRLEGVERLVEEGAPGVGGGIRCAAGVRSEAGLGAGESKASFEFEVSEEIADVELVLELRASHGSAAFRIDSLRLARE